MKRAVERHFGKWPNDAYLRSPTPWGDLYKTYSWSQTQLILVAESAEILEITSEPTILKTQTFKNESSVPATFNAGIHESVSNTTESHWNTGGTLTIGQKFTYKVGFLGTGGEGETSLSYSQSWGVGGSNSKTITVGSTSGVEVELDPGQAVIAELSANRGIMRSEFDTGPTLLVQQL